jgi:intracellular sulfur oxidation DsrE/DsrF family protein
MQPIRSLFKCFALFFVMLPGLALADKPSDRNALEGVTQGRIIWDINMGNAQKLGLYLKVIAETYDDLKRQGVDPDMVFAFRGASVKLISTKHDDLPLDEVEHQEAVASQLKELLSRANVRMEACSIAMRLFGVDTTTLLPGIEPVGNTFVSLMGYQMQGYASILIM